MKLEGEKIILRPFCESDAKFILEMKNEADGMKAFAGSPFPSNYKSEIEWINNMYPKGITNVVYLAIEDKESNEFSGYCIARGINYINRNAEVGFILHENARGKGFFKDVSKTFYKYLFNEINLHKVYSFVLTDNKIAYETDLKIGFKSEGIIKEHIYQDGTYKDVYFISLYKKDFMIK